MLWMFLKKFAIYIYKSLYEDRITWSFLSQVTCVTSLLDVASRSSCNGENFVIECTAVYMSVQFFPLALSKKAIA